MASLVLPPDSATDAPPTVTTLPSGKSIPTLGRRAHYDVLVLGTGLTECCLAGLLSSRGKQVLMLDRNNYYGGASASLNLTDLYKKFKPNNPTIPPELAHLDPNEFQCDLTPKFIMSDGTLVKIIQSTGATRYLDFMPIEGSYCVRDNTFHKVPATTSEAVKTKLVGFFQKRYLKNLLKYVVNVKLDDQNNDPAVLALKTTTARELIMTEHWCSENTTEFIGHCIALHQDNAYLDQPALQTVKNMKKYATSLAKYGTQCQSPFIYPEYGLGGLSEAFARLCSINGGDFILGRAITCNDFVPTTAGSASASSSASSASTKETAAEAEEHASQGKTLVTCMNPHTNNMEGCRVNAVVGDPSYFNAKKRKRHGSIIRCICLLRGPVDGLPEENVQIIYPQGQCTPKRKNDIYISIVGNSLKCTPTNSTIWSATMSTVLEQTYEKEEGGEKEEETTTAKGSSSSSSSSRSNKPLSELTDCIALLGGEKNIIDMFHEVTPYYVPEDGCSNEDCIYVSKSMDATTHFESTTLDVIRLYEQITGEAFHLDSKEENESKT